MQAIPILRSATKVRIGKQLFERNRNLDDESSLVEEGAVSVDASQYDRTERADEEPEPDRIEVSDSD